MPIMCPVGSFQRTHNKLSMWFNFTINSQRTHWVYSWVHCDQITRYILKELSMSGSDTLWVHFDQNRERTQWVHSQNTCWVIWWVHFEFDHNWWVSFKRTLNLPAGQSVSKLLKNSQQTHNVLSWCSPVGLVYRGGGGVDWLCKGRFVWYPATCFVDLANTLPLSEAFGHLLRIPLTCLHLLWGLYPCLLPSTPLLCSRPSFCGP